MPFAIAISTGSLLCVSQLFASVHDLDVSPPIPHVTDIAGAGSTTGGIGVGKGSGNGAGTLIGSGSTGAGVVGGTTGAFPTGVVEGHPVSTRVTSNTKNNDKRFIRLP